MRVHVHAEAPDAADDDAKIIRADRVLTDIDNRKRGVPLAESVTLQNIRADQIKESEIVWHNSASPSINRQLAMRRRDRSRLRF